MKLEDSKTNVEIQAEALLKAFSSADIPNHLDYTLERVKMDSEMVNFAAWVCAEALIKESRSVNPERESFWISVRDYINR